MEQGSLSFPKEPEKTVTPIRHRQLEKLLKSEWFRVMNLIIRVRVHDNPFQLPDWDPRGDKNFLGYLRLYQAGLIKRLYHLDSYGLCRCGREISLADLTADPFITTCNSCHHEQRVEVLKKRSQPRIYRVQEVAKVRRLPLFDGLR